VGPQDISQSTLATLESTESSKRNKKKKKKSKSLKLMSDHSLKDKPKSLSQVDEEKPAQSVARTLAVRWPTRRCCETNPKADAAPMANLHQAKMANLDKHHHILPMRFSV
jgi:hypothetical protein